MEYIFTPWREKYVKNVFKMKRCIFCRALEQNNDRKALILFRGSQNFILLNKYPYTPGHLMIAPFEHLDTVEKAKKDGIMPCHYPVFPLKNAPIGRIKR